MTIGLLLVIFFVSVFVTIPIGSVMAFLALLPGILNPGFTANPAYVIRAMLNGIDSFPLLAVPMFVLSGIIMARGGISKRLFNVFTFFIGKRTAGLPCAIVVTCLFYGAISGSGPATVAAVGSMTIPILISMGYDKVFVVSLVAIAGGLGVIIPPSIPFILFGTSTGTSVGSLFIAGIFPSILIGIFLMAYAYYYCKKHGEDKETINKTVDELRSQGFLHLLADSSWALLTPVIILGSIYSGIATPTEAAMFSVYYSLIISLLIYRTLKPKELFSVFVEAGRGYGPIMFVLMAAMAFSKVLNLLQIPQNIQVAMTMTFTTKWSMLVIINLMLLVVGMIMDTSAAILILAPLFTPIVSALGVNSIHFGVIMVCNLAIGFVTPPVGVNLFVASSMTGVPMMQIAKKAVPLIIMFLFALVLITVFPAISLTLVGGH